jgi:glutamate synthase (ferredoxin)
MTGGRVLVLGRAGRNFAAGMSGGIAYALDSDGQFARRCNREMVDLEPLIEAADVELVRDLLRRHVVLTGSTYAERLLRDFARVQGRMVKVMPRDYKRVLMAQTETDAEARAVKRTRERVGKAVTTRVIAGRPSTGVSAGAANG